MSASALAQLRDRCDAIAKRVSHLSGERAALRREHAELIADRKHCNTERAYLEQAHVLVLSVAKDTQEQLVYHISDLCSLANSAVFDNPYRVRLSFESKRGRTEARVVFCRDGNEMDPEDSSGGGTVDVAAFALRVALWSLQRERTRPVFILDEPFRFLSARFQSRACAMLREISRQLKVQIIMVTHEGELMDAADRVFNVSLKNGTSVVSVV